MENNIKITINNIASEENDISVLDDVKNETEIKNNVWDKALKYVFIGLTFLVPVFVLPFTIFPLEINKAFLSFIGIAVLAVLYLINFIQKGKIEIPKSVLLLNLFLLVLVYFFSSIFSSNRALSLIGEGYGLDSFSSVALLSFLAALTALFFSESKGAMSVFYSLFVSSIVIFIFQLMRTVFNTNILPFNIFPSKTSNLFGTWNELGIFFGFTALLSSVFFKFLNKRKIFFGAVLLLSLLGMAVVNFEIAWLVLGVFSLIFLIYIFSSSKDTRSFASLPLVLFIISVLFVFLNPVVGSFLTNANLNYLEVRPSWSGTFDIIKNSLKADPFLGSGPGTFVYNWLNYRPQAINLTQFWAARFNSGVGLLPSFFATAGILAVLLWICFFVLLISQFLKILAKGDDNGGEGISLMLASFFASLYLWVFNIIYVPSFALTFLAYLFTGLLIAELSRKGKIKIWKISFLSEPKIKFIASLSVLVIIVASLGIFYVFSKKYAASYYFAKGISSFNGGSDLPKAEDNILKAVNFDPQDRYFRGLTEIGLLKMQRTINNSSLPADELRAEFQRNLSSTIQYAQLAVNANNSDSLNWINMAKVYESVMPLKIEGAAGLALNNYAEAAKRDPNNPDNYIAEARVFAQENNLNEAKNALQKAITLKPDYAVPIFTLAQVEAASGNLEEAIKRTKDTYFLAPNDIGVLFQLGLLYYQKQDFENSKVVFEKTVSLNPNYSNAMYFLGLIYDKGGRKEDAIKVFERIEGLNPDNQEIKKILNNLRKGKNALESIVPPGPSPEKRQSPPVK